MQNDLASEWRPCPNKNVLRKITNAKLFSSFADLNSTAPEQISIYYNRRIFGLQILNKLLKHTFAQYINLSVERCDHYNKFNIINLGRNAMGTRLKHALILVQQHIW